MSDFSKQTEAATLKLIENVLMGNKDEAQNALNQIVSMRLASQIQKVGKEKLI